MDPSQNLKQAATIPTYTIDNLIYRSNDYRRLKWEEEMSQSTTPRKPPSS